MLVSWLQLFLIHVCVHQDVCGSLHLSVIIFCSFIISFFLFLVDASSSPTTEPAALKKEYEKLKKAFDDVIKERDYVKKECDAIKKKFDDARKERDDTSQTLADVIEANQGLVKDNEDLQKSRAASTKVIDDLQKQLQGRNINYMSLCCDTFESWISKEKSTLCFIDYNSYAFQAIAYYLFLCVCVCSAL